MSVDLDSDDLEVGWTNENGSCNGPIHQPVVVTLFQVFLVGFATTFVCVIGIFGNACSAVVLAGPKMKSSLSCLLLGLTAYDTVLVVNTIIIFCIPALSGYFGIGLRYSSIIEYITPILYATGMTAQTGSVYSVIAVTMERFIAVCKPLYARSMCTWSRAKFYTLGVFLFSALYNLPRWGEFVTVTKDNSTVRNEMTDLRCNPLYITIYVQWSNFVVMILLPIVVLTVLNAIIFAEVHRSNCRRLELTKMQTREISLAVMLLIVVAVFFVCNILPFVNNFMESMRMPLSQDLVDFSNFLVALNSSVNCFIYCIFGAKFRKHFLRLLNSMVPCLSICSKEPLGDPGCYHASTSHNTIRLNYQNSTNYHASARSLLPNHPSCISKPCARSTTSRNGITSSVVEAEAV